MSDFQLRARVQTIAVVSILEGVVVHSTWRLGAQLYEYIHVTDTVVDVCINNLRTVNPV